MNLFRRLFRSRKLLSHSEVLVAAGAPAQMITIAWPVSLDAVPESIASRARGETFESNMQGDSNVALPSDSEESEVMRAKVRHFLRETKTFGR
jgi:hypothetical protein